MGQYFSDILTTPTSTIIALAAICGVAILVLRELFPHAPMALIVYPFCVGASVLVAHTFFFYDFYAPKVMEQWLLFMVLSAGIGVAATFLVYIALSSLIMTMLAIRRLEPLARRSVRHIRLER